ncbi:MAG: hypothetical protein ACR2I4_02905 [Actinomycetota bacterium]|nr:hypothetical protein [Actinomycetota bacterium]
MGLDMGEDMWRIVLSGGLCLNAVAGFAYRLFRLSKGGPLGDVLGQAVLGVVLLALAVAAATGASFAAWASLLYATAFGVVVMPLWVVAVLIPLRPHRVDLVFTAVYWLALIGIGVAALAL